MIPVQMTGKIRCRWSAENFFTTMILLIHVNEQVATSMTERFDSNLGFNKSELNAPYYNSLKLTGDAARNARADV